MLEAIIFILILGLLIFVHELGHFWVARKNGIKAEEFGFGFPPRMFGVIKDEETGKYKIVWGNKEVESKNTVYSLNWIPLGGFVRIKGENGESKDADSFASKGAWPRTKVLAAGVAMNFALAWVLLSLVFAIGTPISVENEADLGGATKIGGASKVQIIEVAPNSPAVEMGIKIGDEIIKNENINSVASVQDYINAHRGQEISLKISRGEDVFELRGVPRIDAPSGQGALGIGLAETIMVRYPLHKAMWNGLLDLLNIIAAMLTALAVIVKGLFSGQGAVVAVEGPIGIAIMTKQFATLGIGYLLRFAAFLSINLGIINALPFPALDGGRIFFIAIEKIKGSPINQKVEHMVNTVGFFLLILLMIIVTYKDIAKLIK